jgi:hypothetical protein
METYCVLDTTNYLNITAMKFTSLIRFAIIGLFVIVQLQTSAQITWNFTAATATGAPANVTAGSVTQVNNNGTTTFLAAGAPVSSTAFYAGASGGNNGNFSARTTAFNTGTSTYLQAVLTPAANYWINITAIQWGNFSLSTTGPNSLRIYTSIDNYTTPIATATVGYSTTNWTLVNPSFTPISGITGTAVTIRIYATGGTGTTPAAGAANWRVDDLRITATAQTGIVGQIPKYSSIGTYTNSNITDFNGNIGIGTTTPDSLLTVNDGIWGKRGVRFSGLPVSNNASDSMLVVTTSGANAGALGLRRIPAASGGSGTVSSIGAGYGITGGTITTTGTHGVDTGLIATRAWRQKGVDSLQININALQAAINGKINIADTSAMLLPYARKSFLNAGTGINYNSSTGQIVNTAPDQTVNLTAGTGIGITGAYPNFTIVNNSPASGGTFIQNQNSSAQPSSNFWISGNGVANGDITANSLFASGANNFRIGNPGVGMGIAADANNIAFRLPNSSVDKNFYFQTFGGAGTLMTLTDAGNLGIGTTPSTFKLDVNGPIRFTNNISSNNFMWNGDNGFGVWGNNGLPLFNTAYGFVNSWSPTAMVMKLKGINGQANDYFNVVTSTESKLFTINSVGNVGIGVDNPSALLHTNGALRFQGLTNGNSLNRILATDSLGNVFWKDASNISSNSWGLSGNTGTSSSNFLGTSDNYSLRFRTNNVERMILDSIGDLTVNRDIKSRALHFTQTGTWSSIKNLAPTNGFELVSNGMMIFRAANGARNAYLKTDGDFALVGGSGEELAGIGTNNGTNNLIFKTNGAPSISPVERMRLTAAGNLGIGVTTPSAQLHTNGSLRFQGLSAGSGNPLVVDSLGNVSVGSTNSNSLNAMDGLSKAGNDLFLGSPTSSSGAHNFSANRYQYLNGNHYSIGGSVNNPDSFPVFRFYDNGDFSVKTTNQNISSLRNGMRYNARLGYLQLGLSNNIDTTVSNSFGPYSSSAILLNTDDPGSIQGKLLNAFVGAYNVQLPTNAVITASMLTGGSFFMGANTRFTQSIGGGVYHNISAPVVNGSIIMGNSQAVTRHDYNSAWVGYNNRNANGYTYGNITGGWVNNVGAPSQLTVGTYLTNRSYAATALGNKNVDFATLPYNSYDSMFLNNTQNIEGRYLLFSLGNSASKNGATASNAMSVLYNGRTQINTTGFTNNLTEAAVTPKAALEIVSTNSGVLLPKLTNAQRDSIGLADLHNGLLLYNTDSSQFQYYNGSLWKPLGSNSAAALANGWSLTGNAGTNPATNFIGTTDNVDIIFKRNGIKSGLIGANNVAFGNSSLLNNTSGTYNVALGVNALMGNTSGNYNNAIGRGALQSNTTGYLNIAIGDGTMSNNISGHTNVGVGPYSLLYNTTGISNTGVGTQTLTENTTGNYNQAFGRYALVANTIGSDNVAAGLQAMYSNNSGNNNVAVGNYSLFSNISGSNNISIGYRSDVGTDALTNAIAIGAQSYVTQSNSMVLGSIAGINGAGASTNVGIGVTSPSALLHTNGSLRFEGLGNDNTLTRYLAVDSIGNVFWKDASTVANNLTFSDGLIRNGNNVKLGGLTHQTGEIGFIGSLDTYWQAKIKWAEGTLSMESKDTADVTNHQLIYVSPEERSAVLQSYRNNTNGTIAVSPGVLNLVAGNNTNYNILTIDTNYINLSRFKNTAALDSVLTTDTLGNLKLVKLNIPSTVDSSKWLRRNQTIYNADSSFVGIGTDSALAKLHINGDVLLQTYKNNPQIDSVLTTDENGKLIMAYRPFGSGGGGAVYNFQNGVQQLNGNVSFGGILQDSVKLNTNNKRFAIDNGTQKLFHIAGDNNIGLGTAMPAARLDIQQLTSGDVAYDALRIYKPVDSVKTWISFAQGTGAGTSAFRLGQIGQFSGLGLYKGGSNPAAPGQLVQKWDVNGYTGINTSETTGELSVGAVHGNKLSIGNSQWAQPHIVATGTHGTYGDYTDIKVAGSLFNSAFMRINKAGNVGIGTINIDSTFRLSVNGKIRAKGLKVESGNWADFVFEPGYKLRTLTEVENFIHANKHLPEVPTSDQVKKEGTDVGEIQALLLQKIEELTLYIIDQDKKVKALEEKNKTLQQQAGEIDTIKKQIEELKKLVVSKH